MLKIGLTGGIGSGKSIIAKVFEQLGIPVFNSDAEAKKLINSDPKISTVIKENFGKNSYGIDGQLDRKRLAEIVFNDEEALHKLNSIVHPAVQLEFLSWLNKHKQAPYILKEAAIIFESGSNKGLDKVIAISAPELLRIQRTVKRDNSSPQSVKKRIEKQMSEDEKLKRSDFIIYNDEMQLVLPQVLKLHELFAARKE